MPATSPVFDLLRRLGQAIGHEDWQAAGQLELQLRGALVGSSAEVLQTVLERYVELVHEASKRRRVLARRISQTRRRHAGASNYAAMAAATDEGI